MGGVSRFLFAGSVRELFFPLCRRCPCHVGSGMRDLVEAEKGTRREERDETGVDLVRNGEGKEDYLRARFACPGDSG